MFQSHHISRALAVALAVTALAAPSALARPAADSGSSGTAHRLVAPGVPPELRYPHAYAPAEFRSTEPASPAPAADVRAADDDSAASWRSVILGLALLTAFGGLGLALVRVRGPRGARLGAH